jgi:hypothetical protein
VAAVRCVAFCAAIVLPFVLVALVAVAGLGTARLQSLFVALVVCDVCAVVVGHGYAPRRSESTPTES